MLLSQQLYCFWLLLSQQLHAQLLSQQLYCFWLLLSQQLHAQLLSQQLYCFWLLLSQQLHAQLLLQQPMSTEIPTSTNNLGPLKPSTIWMGMRRRVVAELLSVKKVVVEPSTFVADSFLIFTILQERFEVKPTTKIQPVSFHANLCSCIELPDMSWFHST